MSIKSMRTGLAAAIGGAVLVGGLLVGASIAKADNPEGAGPAVENHISHSGAAEFAHHLRLGADLDQLANDLGLSVDELRQKLRDGASLQDIADEAGVDLSTIVARMKDRLKAAIDEKVVAGRLTRDQADVIKQKIDSFDTGDIPTGDLLGALRNGLRLVGPSLEHRNDWLADLNLDIDLDQLREKLDSGSSLKEALSEMGVDVDSVVARLKQSALDKIDQLVADGTITQGRADEMRRMVENFSFGDRQVFGPGSHHPDPGHSNVPGRSELHPGAGFQFFNRDRGSDTPSGAVDSSNT